MQPVFQIAQRRIIVKTQLEALHCWPDVPPSHSSQFLKHPHRHLFQIELQFIVEHNNRDLEFIQIKQQVDRCLHKYFKVDHISGLVDLEHMSCEMLCEFLLKSFNYLGVCQVTVLEDGEMGSMLSIFGP